MARNKYPGLCYRCGARVEIGEGHFERHNGGWRLQHAACAIRHRNTPQEKHAAMTANERTKARATRRRKAKDSRLNGPLPGQEG